MRLWRVLLVAAVAAVVSSGGAWAQEKKSDKPKMTAEEQFKKLDKDANGSLTCEEFVGARGAKKPEMKEKLEATFKKLDKDSDGKLTLDEFKAMSVRGGKKKKTQ